MTKTKGIRKGLKMFGSIEFQKGDFQYQESISYTLMPKSFKFLKNKEMPKETLKALKLFKNESFHLQEDFTHAMRQWMEETFMKEWETELLLSAQIAGRFNGEKYVEFLQQLARHFKDPIILIEDGAPYHKSKVVKTSWQNRVKGWSLNLYPLFLPILIPSKNCGRIPREMQHTLNILKLLTNYVIPFSRLLENIWKMPLTSSR